MDKDNEPVELELTNPADARRLMQASEVAKLFLQDGLSIDAACAQAGISRATYTRWVQAGVFAPLLQAYVTPILHEAQKAGLDLIPDILGWARSVLDGSAIDATNFDRLNVSKFLWAEIIKPALALAVPAVPPANPDADPGGKEEKQEDPAEAYLRGEPEWASQLRPGESIKISVEKQQSPPPIDVTPVAPPGESTDPAPAP